MRYKIIFFILNIIMLGEYSQVLETQAKDGVEAISASVSAAAISYLYFDDDFDIDFFGFTLKPYMLMGLVVLVSEYLQANIRDNVIISSIGEENSQKLGMGLNPVATGLGASVLIMLNSWYKSGSITKESFYIPFAIGATGSLVGQYFRKMTSQTIEDIL